ncbi:MAG: AAA family ATPase [Actinomycetota bacterium]|nr:AAA family ATPase [Actinomycetota bacterium]
MGKVRALLVCSECGQQMAQWAGRCPGCGSWGSVQSTHPAGTSAGGRGSALTPVRLDPLGTLQRRIPTGVAGVDRVLGGGLLPGSVTLLAGEPGIGKSTLLLQLVMHLSTSGLACLFASGEESLDQVAGRAARLGGAGDRFEFIPGRDLADVVETARTARPFLLAVDSIQALREGGSTQVPGGPAQVRTCADALVGLAKACDVAVVMTGHVTKDGDLAGPRTLEHAVDTLLSFEGDPRSGMRVLAAGKNRFGQEGEMAWFEMRADGLTEIDPRDLLLSGQPEAGAATALAAAGRRAIAVEVQTLVAPTEGPARRQATGLDPKRFQLVAAVMDRMAGLPLARSELYGAAVGGIRLEDPACDLAVAASLASAANGVRPPPNSAFVGEVGLTGAVRASPGMSQRIAAAKAAGVTRVFAAPTADDRRWSGLKLQPVGHLSEAVDWAVAG